MTKQKRRSPAKIQIYMQMGLGEILVSLKEGGSKNTLLIFQYETQVWDPWFE